MTRDEFAQESKAGLTSAGIREAWPAAFSGLVALLIRLVYVTDMRRSPLFDRPIMDAEIHDRWARGSLDFLYEGVPYFRAPLYPWMLQAIYAIDPGYLLVRIVQAFLSAATVALCADLGRRIAGGWAGMFSGMLLAMYWPAVYFSGELLIVTQMLTLAIASLWLFVVAAERDDRRLALAGAAVLGLASIARPTVLAFLPMLLVLTLWAWPRMGLSHLGQRRPWFVGALLGLVLLPGLSLTVRNRVVGDDWVFIASQGGVNFYIGNNPQSDGRTAVVPGTRSTWRGGYDDSIRLAEQAEGRELKPSELSRHYYSKGFAFLSGEPAAAMRLYRHKLRLLLGAGERSNNKNMHYWRQKSPLLRLPVFVSFAPLLALGCVGILLCRRRLLAAPVWGFLLFYSAGLLLFFLNERFRLPLAAGLSIFAGVPLVALRGAVQDRNRRLTALLLLPILGIFCLSQLDRRGFKEGVTEADAFSRYSEANAHLDKGEPERALALYEEALAVAAEFRLRHFDQIESRLRRNRCRALVDLGRLDEAEGELAWLRARFARDRGVRLLGADLEYGRGAHKRAAVQYAALMEEFPGWTEPLARAGLSFFHAGLQERARTVFEAARRDASARERERLRYDLREAIRLDPANAELARTIREAGWSELFPPGASR